MQIYPRLFPQHRLNDPFRQAEKRIFQALESCGAPGLACYEWQRNRRSLQLDFALWVLDVGRFGLQVKGGHYSFSQGEWYRRKGRRGPYVRVNTCPLSVTSDATMSLLNEISEALTEPNYFVPILLFPNMEPDAAISARARRSNVHLIWRDDPLLPRLMEIAREADVRWPPTAADIRSEVAVITDGQARYSEDIANGNPSGPGPAPMASLSTAGVHISSAERMRYHGSVSDRRVTSNREVMNM